MNTLSTLTGLLRPHLRRLVLAALCMLASAVGVLLIPLVIKNLLGAAIAHGRMDFGPLPAALLAGLVAATAAAGSASLLLIFEIAHRVTGRLRGRYVEQVLSAPMAFHRKESTGELIERLTTSIADIEWFIKYGLGTAFGIGVTLAGSVLILFVLNWKLALLVSAAIPVVTAGLRALFRRSRGMDAERQRAAGGLIGQLHEMLLGIEIIKAFGSEQREIERFREKQDRLLAVQRRTARTLALVEPFVVSATLVVFVLFILYGGRLMAAGELTPETFVVFLMYLFLIIPQVRSLSLQLSRWQQLAAAFDRMEATLAVPRETDRPGAIPLASPVRGEVEFRNVVYRYPGRELAADDISFRIAPGECVGVVGESGAGKSTLFNLLLRFYSPQGGAIRIDGVDIREITASSLRGSIAFVPQDIVLFDDTILENVRFGRPAAGDEDVRAACRAAQTEGFIQDLPEGYMTVLGDRGLNLSGGQRQRLAIARALLKNAAILLLDEATSSLDAHTEKQMRDAMDAAMAGRTTIVIAHRLATVAHLPRILVLARGRIVDDGSHEELLGRCPEYGVFVATQLTPPSVAQPP